MYNLNGTVPPHLDVTIKYYSPAYEFFVNNPYFYSGKKIEIAFVHIFMLINSKLPSLMMCIYPLVQQLEVFCSCTSQNYFSWMELTHQRQLLVT